MNIVSGFPLSRRFLVPIPDLPATAQSLLFPSEGPREMAGCQASQLETSYINKIIYFDIPSRLLQVFQDRL